MANPSLSTCNAEIKANSGKHYVYVLMRPSGEPFYVGISKARSRGNQRVARHFFDARAGLRLYRHNIIRKIWREGEQVAISIDSWHTSRIAAAEREIELIKSLGRYDMGTGSLANKTSGGEGVSELSSETRSRMAQLLSVRMKLKFSDPAWRAAHAAKLKKHHSDPDVRRKIAEEQRVIGGRNRDVFKARIQNWAINNPAAMSARKERAAATMRSPEGKLRASERSKKYFSDPANREEQSRKVTKRFSDESERERQSARLTIAFSRPDYRKKRSNLSKVQMGCAQMRKRLSDAANIQWSDPIKRLEAATRAKASAKIRREIRQRCMEILERHGATLDLPSLVSKIEVWRDTESALIKLFVSRS